MSRRLAVCTAALFCATLAACGGRVRLDPLELLSVTANPPAANVGDDVAFTVVLSGGAGEMGLAYAWDFGDGGTSTEQAPVHAYDAPSGYMVTVTVTRLDDDAFVAGSVKVVVGADSAPVVNVGASPETGLVPLTVQFTSQVAGGEGPYTYAWDFGDGGTSGLPSPAHAYAAAGSYDATLTVTDADGDTGMATTTITVADDEIPAASATVTPTMGLAPLDLDFDCTATGGNPPYLFAWDFGDGNGALVATGTHTYATGGTFVATCLVTDADGDQGSDSVTVTVDEDDVPRAVAAASYAAMGVPLTVTFTGVGTGGDAPLGYGWEFGDGATSTLQDPVHVYTAPGVYAATLTVTDADGDTGIDMVTIMAGTGTVPVAVAAATPTTGGPPLLVTFTGTAIGGEGAITYDWDFGDGATSTVQSPTHTYAADGNYTATLTVTDVDGDLSSDSLAIVVVTDNVPTAGAAATPTTGIVPLAVAFTGTATGGDAPLSYLWTFGDGGTSSSLSPAHTYTASGTFQAALQVTDADGDVATDSVTITVDPVPGNAPPTVVATIVSGACTVPASAFIPGTPTLVDASASTDPEGAALVYAWTFVTVPPGSFAAFSDPALANPTFTADREGVYTFRVFVSDGVNDVAGPLMTVVASGTPGTIVVLGGDGQMATGGQPFALPFDVEILNACGVFLPSITLGWIGGGVSPDQPFTATDPMGLSSNGADALAPGPATLTVEAYSAADALCGDGVCGVFEDCLMCAPDCGTCGGTCGDGTCDGVETCSTCDVDCGHCVVASATFNLTVIPAQCQNGADDDGDSIADYPFEPGCVSAVDDDETDPLVPPECADVVDNDGDSLFDYPADPGCAAASDDNESELPVLSEVFGGTPDYEEVFNPTGFPIDLGGIVVSWGLCDFNSFTFLPGTMVPPGGYFRLVEDFSAMLPNEVNFGTNICDNPTGGGWVALCVGPCDFATCSNVIDYFEKGFSAAPGPCASFTPAPLDVSFSGFGESATRVGFGGSGPNGVLADWVVLPVSRD